MEVNSIYCGDCLEILKHFPSESADLIYLDPPFFSNKHYEIIWKDGAEIRAFGDRWKGGIHHYVGWMKERLEQCERVLKKTGSIHLHCDYHASHYLKLAMDKIFGINNFRNEIIWSRKTSTGSKNKMASSHDTIFYYTKSNSFVFNQHFSSYSEDYIRNQYTHKDGKGRIYRIHDVVANPALGGTSPRYSYKGYTPKTRWLISKDKLEELDKEGKIEWSKTGRPCRRLYLDEMQGQPISDVWTDIPISLGKERLGYPTQKPLALLERIIKLSSNKNDIVLDPFCGCGTTLVEAKKLGRRWIGIDVSRTACKLMQRRMRSVGASPHIIWGELSEKELKKYPPFEFQNWVCEKLGGRMTQRKSGDMGIDGWTLDMTPIQVKQSDHVGRNPIDNFQSAIRRQNKKKGIFIAFSFGKGAYGEAARIKNEEEIEIKLITVKELLGK